MRTATDGRTASDPLSEAVPATTTSAAPHLAEADFWRAVASEVLATLSSCLR